MEPPENVLLGVGGADVVAVTVARSLGDAFIPRSSPERSVENTDNILLCPGDCTVLYSSLSHSVARKEF